jgi:hypothetical protein
MVLIFAIVPSFLLPSSALPLQAAEKLFSLPFPSFLAQAGIQAFKNQILPKMARIFRAKSPSSQRKTKHFF